MKLSGLPLIVASVSVIGGVLSAPATTAAAEAAASIRDQVRQTGQFERIVVARDNQLQLAGLVGNSELIVEASVTSAKSFLSENGADIYTDYIFTLHAIVKNPRHPGLRPGDTVTVRREHGQVLVDGRAAVSFENGFPAFGTNERYVLFLTPEGSDNVYSVFGGAKGAFAGGDRIAPLHETLEETTAPVATVSRDNFFGDVRALLKFASQ